MRNFWILAAVVLGIGVETRFLGLTDRSLWFDETFSLAMAKLPVTEIIQFLQRHDTHPPLYYALLSLWVDRFGPSETALRSLSAVVGVFMIPLLYVFARRFVGSRAAFAAAALLAGSAFAARAAQEARMYPLLGLLCLGSWYLLVVAVEDRRRGDWAAYVIVTTLMLYTHYFGFLVVASQLLYLLPRMWRDHAIVGPVSLALGSVAVLFLPWVPAFVNQTLSGLGWPTFRPPAGPRAIIETLGLFAFGGELLGMGGYFHTGALPLWRAAVVAAPFVALVVAGGYALRGQRAWPLLCYWLVPIGLALAISQRSNIYYPRYFSFLAPAWALLTAAGLDWIAARVQQPSRGVMLAGLTGVLLAVNVPVIDGYVYKDTGMFDWRGAASVVTAQAGPHDFLLFVPEFAHAPFEYYFRGHQERYGLTPVEVYRMVRMPAPRGPVVDKAWAGRLAEAHPQLWIIVTAPVPGPAFLRLRELFEDSFAPVQAWDFSSVYVYQLLSRSHPPVGSKP